MPIGQSRLHDLVRRRRLLVGAVVWFEAFDTDLKNQIIRWIQDDQLRPKGIDADGEVIGFYSLTTSFINPIKKFNSHYTLEDTGSFYRSMFVQVLSDRILIDASSESYEEMQDQDWFTDRILNLTDENIQLLKTELKQKYIKAVRRVLFGT